MIFIHKLVPMSHDADTLHVHGLEIPTPLLTIDGVLYNAQPLKVHQPPEDEFDVPGTRIWRLTSEDMYFTTPEQAERVFVLLHGRMPDLGVELRSVELVRVKDLYSDPEPNYDDRYYGCPEHAMFGDRWYFNDPYGEL